MTEFEQWEQRYRASAAVPMAARVLAEFQHLLPPTGAALDLACGLGGNALLLAARGLCAAAWDGSGEAIARLQATAAAGKLAINAAVRDVVANPPPPDSFDVIVVSRFLDRGLCPTLAAALRPGGLLYYQTFVHDKVADSGPRNPAFLLERNELLYLFPELTVRFYREEGTVGDVSQGWRNEAYFVGQRPL